jgi:hypothetical protein
MSIKNGHVPKRTNWSERCQMGLFACKKLLGSFRRRRHSIAQSPMVAVPGTALLSLALARLDKVLEATRSLGSRFPAIGATLVALHPQLVLPLAGNR